MNDTKQTGLNARQERFCEEYLIDLCAKDAAMRAGYSPTTAGLTGHRLINHDNCKARIDELKAERRQETKVTANQIVQNLRRLAQKCEDVGKTGDAIRANELLGKHIGMFNQDAGKEGLKITLTREEPDKEPEILTLEQPDAG